MTVPAVAGALAGLAVLAARPGRPVPPTMRGRCRPSRAERSSPRAVATTGARLRPSDELLQVLDMVSAQVRAGAEPTAAWAAAVEVCAVDLPGPDPLHTLELLACAPQRRRLRRPTAELSAVSAGAAAAAWLLAQRTGAPLADLLDSVCSSVRADQDDRAFLAAATAGPQATARLLLALPVAGIGLGQLVGAQPLDVLLTTTAGRTCGVVGLALLLVGRVWMSRLVRSVEAAGRPSGAGAST